jgi:hypothetical protein
MRAGKAGTNLVHKRVVKIIGAANAEVDDVHFGRHGIVKGIQKPGRVRYLLAPPPQFPSVFHTFKTSSAMFIVTH